MPSILIFLRYFGKTTRRKLRKKAFVRAKHLLFDFILIMELKLVIQHKTTRKRFHMDVFQYDEVLKQERSIASFWFTHERMNQ